MVAEGDEEERRTCGGGLLRRHGKVGSKGEQTVGTNWKMKIYKMLTSRREQELEWEGDNREGGRGWQNC